MPMSVPGNSEPQHYWPLRIGRPPFFNFDEPNTGELLMAALGACVSVGEHGWSVPVKNNPSSCPPMFESCRAHHKIKALREALVGVYVDLSMD
jgi:hypothetical protein